VPDLRPTVRQLLLKGVARVRARGPLEPLTLALTRARESFASSDRLIILVRPAAGSSEEIGHVSADGLRFARATPADADEYARAIGTDSPVTFTERLTDTTWCYLVRARGTIVLSTWCTTSVAWTREIRAFLAPPPGDAYVFESLTRPEVRGQGVYPFALTAIAADLGRTGIARVWIAVEAGNRASLRAVAKAGFEPHSEIRFHRRWGVLTIDDPPSDAAPEGLTIAGAPPG
jgi:hypothetical protein